MEPSEAAPRPQGRGGIARSAAALGLGLVLAGCWGSPAPRSEEKPKGPAPKFTAGEPLVFPAERTPATCAVWATVPSGSESSAAMARGGTVGTMSGAASGTADGAAGSSAGQGGGAGTTAGGASGMLSGAAAGSPTAPSGTVVNAGLYQACLQADAR